ncbi:hypothetical protein FOE78_19080 [Microlunatus elymi]|uniref:Uncharacterized protein n=1 Tax=Microlunatus elymi TaxID=2596828 RepID=A0A516Q2S4_9ACTN|nr:hypothetical protein [Microlunatus elymi]QDP97733.1 hypothetical protein FOE78_19080 [Microlunatus elymi]
MVAIVGVVAYLPIAGYLLILASAVESGGVLSWKLDLVAVTQPKAAVFQMIGVFFWVAIVFWGLLRASSRFRASERRLALWTASGLLLAVVIVFLLTSEFPQVRIPAESGGSLLGIIRTSALDASTLALAAGLAVVPLAASHKAPVDAAGLVRSEPPA